MAHSRCIETWQRAASRKKTHTQNEAKMIGNVDTGRRAAVSKSASDGPTAAAGIGLHANDFIMRMTACLLAPLPWFEVATLQRFMGSIESLPTGTASVVDCAVATPIKTHTHTHTLVRFQSVCVSHCDSLHINGNCPMTLNAELRFCHSDTFPLSTASSPRGIFYCSAAAL